MTIRSRLRALERRTPASSWPSIASLNGTCDTCGGLRFFTLIQHRRATGEYAPRCNCPGTWPPGDMLAAMYAAAQEHRERLERGEEQRA